MRGSKAPQRSCDKLTAKNRAPLPGCYAAYRPRLPIPAETIPPSDPAGAQPWRDHRTLARVSRHEVPMTPGIETHNKVYDPARVSHSPVRHSVRHPGGVAGIFPRRSIPGSSSGLTPLLDTRAIYANRQTFWVEILCGLILLSYFEVVVGII